MNIKAVEKVDVPTEEDASGDGAIDFGEGLPNGIEHGYEVYNPHNRIQPFEDPTKTIDRPTEKRCRGDDTVRCDKSPYIEICEIQLCDGTPDCPDGEDEDESKCATGSVQNSIESILFKKI